MFERLTSEFAEPSTNKVAALKVVAAVEGMEGNMTVVEAIAVADGMEENVTVVEVVGPDMTVEAIAVADGMEENVTVVEVVGPDMTVEAIAVAEGMEENLTVVEVVGADMSVVEEHMTVEARGHYTCMIAAALVAEESVVAVAAVVMENGEGSRAVAGAMAHWQLDPGEKRS